MNAATRILFSFFSSSSAFGFDDENEDDNEHDSQRDIKDRNPWLVWIGKSRLIRAPRGRFLKERASRCKCHTDFIRDAHNWVVPSYVRLSKQGDISKFA